MPNSQMYVFRVFFDTGRYGEEWHRADLKIMFLRNELKCSQRKRNEGVHRTGLKVIFENQVGLMSPRTENTASQRTCECILSEAGHRRLHRRRLHRVSRYAHALSQGDDEEGKEEVPQEVDLKLIFCEMARRKAHGIEEPITSGGK